MKKINSVFRIISSLMVIITVVSNSTGYLDELKSIYLVALAIWIYVSNL